MVLKSLLLVIVIAILMEDSTSIKKTPEEEKEEREMAEKVNATLAEEEEKERREEEEKEKKKQDQEKKGAGQVKETGGTDKEKGQDEACPTLNQTCPEQKTCPEVRSCLPCPEIKTCSPCEQCPLVKDCPESKKCPPCKECDTCPDVEPCQPCQPCSSNISSVQPPSNPGYPEPAQIMSVPAAMAVGAVASLLMTGVAAAVGLVIRYFSPLESGFIFLATIIIVWYFCSHHPETAREIGARAATFLREAAAALSHRIVEAIRHHNEQVGVLHIHPTLPKIEFQVLFEKFALRFSM
jgi:hypothetical protein